MTIDRLSMRERPRGWPIMYQTWDNLAFMHWPVAGGAIRPLIPPRLEVDTFQGEAWIAITPLAIYGLRPAFVPPLPYLSQSLEINVRTYVHLNGKPGVWFFSLDASNLFAVLGARSAFSLPYFHAQMKLSNDGTRSHFASQRCKIGSPLATFEAEWTRELLHFESQPGSLEFFLTERYCLYTRKGEKLYRVRIHHSPWKLSHAALTSFNSTMTDANGLPAVAANPLLHAQAERLVVETWPPQSV